MILVTPAHDFIDFAIARRHNLPLDISCIDEAGMITNTIPSEFAGLDRFEARDMVGWKISKFFHNHYLKTTESAAKSK